MSAFNMRMVCGVAALAFAQAGQAAEIAVANASFETVPAVGMGLCGAGCSFTISPIPGWVNAGGTNGQFLPGSAAGTSTYFDYVPDGVAVAFSNLGTISQTLAATARAGSLYTLLVDLGVRHDYGDPGTATLTIGRSTVVAVGAPAPGGGWSTYTARYVASARDAGAPITVTLDSSAVQGDFDNVRVSAVGVPEPGSWALLLTGFGIVGIAARRRPFARA